jgi:hypothetical protein
MADWLQRHPVVADIGLIGAQETVGQVAKGWLDTHPVVDDTPVLDSDTWIREKAKADRQTIKQRQQQRLFADSDEIARYSGKLDPRDIKTHNREMDFEQEFPGEKFTEERKSRYLSIRDAYSQAENLGTESDLEKMPKAQREEVESAFNDLYRTGEPPKTQASRWAYDHLYSNLDVTSGSDEKVDESVRRLTAQANKMFPGADLTEDDTRKLHGKADRQLSSEYARMVTAGTPFYDLEVTLAQGGRMIASPIARALGWSEQANTMNRYADELASAAAAQDVEGGMPPILRRGLRGAGSTLPNMVVAGRAGGPYAAIAVAAAGEADAAYTRALDKGMEQGDAAKYALTQGMIEAAPAIVMQRLGLGGFESIASQGGKQAVVHGIGEGLKRAGISMLQELPEEIVTELGHNVADKLSGIDPKATDKAVLRQVVADTTVQTLITGGLLNAAHVGQAAIDARTEQAAKSALLQELREIRSKGWVSVEEGKGKELGLSEEEMTNRASRKAAVDKRIQQIEQEIRDAEETARQAQAPSEEEGLEGEAGGQVRVRDVGEAEEEVVRTANEPVTDLGRALLPYSETDAMARYILSYEGQEGFEKAAEKYLSTHASEETPAAPQLPDTRGQGVQYHGARGEVSLDDEGYANEDNIYGSFNTFYTTDAIDVAQGYGRKQPNAKVYRVTEKQPVKFYNMEQPIESRERFKELFGTNHRGDMHDIVSDVLQSLADDGITNPSLRRVMDEIRAESRSYGMSKSAVQELFDAATYNLSNEGFGGMTHIGGRLTQQPEHTVKIYFDPVNQIELQETELPTEAPESPVTPPTEPAFSEAQEAPETQETPPQEPESAQKAQPTRSKTEFEAMKPRELGELTGTKWVGVKKSVLVDRAMESQETPPEEPDFGKDPSSGVGIAATVPIAPRGGIGRSVKNTFQKFFTSRGELPADVYDAKVRKEGRVAKEMNALRFAATDFRRGIRQALGGKELSQADVEKMNSVLRGEADMATVPEEVRTPLQAMRDHIDSLSRQLIAEGVAQGDLVGIISENLGVYATRSYRVFDDPKWRDKVPYGVRNKAIGAIRNMYPEASDAEVQGVLESLLFRGAAESPATLLKGSKLGSKDMSVFMRRKEVPEWLRDLWGEYKDAGVNYARSVFKMSHLLANQQFLNEVREIGMGKWLRTQEEGPVVNEYGEVITPIAAEGSSVMAPLNGLYTTPELKAAFERFNSPQSMPVPLRIFMSVNYAVKYGKTVGSMMTHIRNLISNTGFAVANGHWRLDKAGKALWATATGTFQLSNEEFRSYYKRLAELGVVGEDVRAGELKDALRDASQADIDEFLYNREARHAKKITKAGRAGYRFLNALYQAEDGVWKIYAWENEKARYSKAHPEWSEQQVEEHAAKIVRDTYPTYSKIPKAVKALRRFPLFGTFVSFPAEVVRTQFNTISLGIQEMQAPETRAMGAQRLAGTAIALGGLSALSRGMMALFGIGDDEDDDLRWFVPPWQENSRFVYTSKPEKATYRFVDLGYSDPHAYLTDSAMAFMRGDDWKESLWNALTEFLRPFASEEILAKALMDLRSNEDQKIYNPKDTPGEQAKDMIWHMWSKALEPGTISSMRRIHEAVTGTNPNRDLQTEVLALTTGQRLQKIDVEHSLGFRVREFARGLTDIQRIVRKTATSRGTATGEMVATDLARMEKVRMAEFAEMQRIIGAARRLGVPESNIRTLLKDNLPNEIAEQLMTGDYSPYEMTPQTVQQMLKARPEEFQERFAGWHGENLPEAIKRFALPKVGGLPVSRPADPDKAEAYDRKIATAKETLDALGVSHSQAQQLLVEYCTSKGSSHKTYVKRAIALAKLYGHSKEEWLEFYQNPEFKSWRAKWIRDHRKKR